MKVKKKSIRNLHGSGRALHRPMPDMDPVLLIFVLELYAAQLSVVKEADNRVHHQNHPHLARLWSGWHVVLVVSALSVTKNED